MPDAQANYLSSQEALVKLVSEKSVDVAVVAAGQPAPLIANRKPEAQKYIKLLKLGPAHVSSKQALSVYSHSTVKTESYSNLIKENFTTIAVGALLVTSNFDDPYTANNMVRFARSLCQNFATLQAQGHSKWREVTLSFPQLAPDWSYYQPATNEIRARLGRPAVGAAAKPGGKQCSAEKRILGLCG